MKGTWASLAIAKSITAQGTKPSLAQPGLKILIQVLKDVDVDADEVIINSR